MVDFSPQINFAAEQPPPQPDNTALQDHFDAQIKTAVAANKTPDGEAKPFSFEDAVKAGWQNSIIGLSMTGHTPDKQTPEDAPWYQRIATQTTNLALDAPYIAEGAVGGYFSGAPGGTMGGAMALPAAMRKIMIDHYKQGDIQTPQEFLSRAAGATIDAAKGYLVGGVTEGAGGLAESFGASSIINQAAQLTVMTNLSKGLEGHLAGWKDYLDNGVLFFGLKSAEFGANKLGDIYTKTGIQPGQIFKDAQADPSIHADLLSDRPIPQAYEHLVDPMFKGTDQTTGAQPPIPEPKLPAIPTEPTTPEAQAAANILAKIKVGGEDAAKVPYSFKKFYADWVDNLAPIKDVQESMTGGKELPASEDPYKLFRVSRGGYERANQFISDQTVSFKSYKPNGEGLQTILDPVKDDLNGLRVYITAKRAIELEGRGINSGFNIDDAKTVVNGPAARAFEDTAQKIVQYSNRVTAYARDAGLIDPETYKLFTEMNKAYVPFNRVLSDVDADAGTGAAGVQTKNPVKAIKGSDKDIIDPLETTIRNTYALTTLAERNYATNQLLKIAKKSGNIGEGELFEPVKAKIQAINVSNEELSKHITKGGQNKTTIGSNPGNLPATAGQTAANGIDVTFNPENLGDLPIFRAMREPLRDDEIAMFNNGQREVYKINDDPELVTAFKGMPSSMNNPMFKFVSSFTRYFRAGTILNPDFLPRHIIRQNINAYMNSPTGMVPILSAVKGAADMAGDANGELLQQWRSGGGMNSEITAWDRRYIQNSIDKLENGEGLSAWIERTKDNPMSLAKLPYNSVQSALDLAHAAIATHDNFLRFAQFKASMEDLNKQGVTGKDAIIEAAYQSREVLLDNFRRGARMQAVNQIWAFSNLRMQGIDKLARLGAENPARLAMRAGSIASVSMLLWLANHDDPRYKEAQDWQKDNFWLVPLDNWRVPRDGDAIPSLPGMSRVVNGETQYNFGQMLRISKPQESGLLFGSSIEHFLDFAQQRDPQTAINLAKSFKDAIVPEAVPSMAMPVYEAWANKSMFTGGPLVPAASENLLPSYQQTAYTTELAKAMGKIIGAAPISDDMASMIASPPKIENYVRQWTGGLGMYALQLSDKALRMAGALPDPVKPASTLADIPFVRAFVVRYPSASTKSITDFYDQYDHESKVAATIQSLAKGGKFEASRALSNVDPMAQMKLEGFRQALTAKQKLIQNINDNPQMSSAEKRQLIDTTYYQMIGIAQIGNKTMADMAASLKGNQ